MSNNNNNNSNRQQQEEDKNNFSNDEERANFLANMVDNMFQHIDQQSADIHKLETTIKKMRGEMDNLILANKNMSAQIKKPTPISTDLKNVRKPPAFNGKNVSARV